MRLFLRTALLCAALAGLLCGAAFAAPAVGVITDKEAAHLARINEARAANGKPALVLSQTLTDAARLRAKEIAQENGKYFGHTRPNGEKYYTAVPYYNSAGWNGIAENVAEGKQLSSARSAVDALMASEGHRANILSDAANYAGVAAYYGEDGHYYWCELFAYSRPSSDGNKAAEGNANEPTWITSVSDSSLTTDTAAFGNMGTTDLYNGGNPGSVKQMIKNSQDQGKYTLLVLWSTYCGNANHLQLQGSAHGQGQKVSKTSSKGELREANTDTTIPRLNKMSDVDVIIATWGSDGSTMKGAMDYYWPDFKSNWPNAKCVATNGFDTDLVKKYALLIENREVQTSYILYALYKDGKLIGHSYHLDQSNSFDRWAEKIAQLQANVPAEPGKDNGGSDEGEKEQDKPGEGEQEPEKEQDKPGENEQEPEKEQDKPGEGEQEPEKEQDKPGEGEQEPEKEQDKPNEGEQEPEKEQDKPGENEQEPEIPDDSGIGGDTETGARGDDNTVIDSDGKPAKLEAPVAQLQHVFNELEKSNPSVKNGLIAQLLQQIGGEAGAAVLVRGVSYGDKDSRPTVARGGTQLNVLSLAENAKMAHDVLLVDPASAADIKTLRLFDGKKLVAKFFNPQGLEIASLRSEKAIEDGACRFSIDAEAIIKADKAMKSQNAGAMLRAAAAYAQSDAPQYRLEVSSSADALSAGLNVNMATQLNIINKGTGTGGGSESGSGSGDGSGGGCAVAGLGASLAAMFGARVFLRRKKAA